MLLGVSDVEMALSALRPEEISQKKEVEKESGEGDGTPLQCSRLENPRDRGGWWAAVHGVAKSLARLSNFTFAFHFHALEKEMATHSSILPGESQERRSLVGCRLWGRRV